MVRKKQGIEEAPGPRGFIPFQHPKLVTSPPSGAVWLHEIKFDGYRVQLHIKRGALTLYTRNAHDWTDRFPRLRSLAAYLPDCVLDGELIAQDAGGYSDFSSLRSKIHRAPDELVVMVFDILFKGDGDLRPYHLKSRKALLAKIMDAAGDDVRQVYRPVQAAPGEGAALLAAACKLKWEGIVSKRLDAPYRGGDQRSDSWVKAKCRPSESIIVGGYVTKNDRFAYLLGGVREPDGRLRYVGSIKGGYGGSTVADLLPRIRALATDKSPFDVESPRKNSSIHWLKPELFAEVEMAEFTASGKLRQASFKGLREDLGEGNL